MPETRVDTIRPWSAGVPVPAAVAVCAACGTTLTVELVARHGYTWPAASPGAADHGPAP